MRDLVVKPQRAAPDSTAEHLFSEWCGYTIAAALGVPVPEAWIVEIPEDLLSPLGSRASDIIPGAAFATEDLRPSFQCGAFGFPPVARIRNSDSLAGMVVLDTLMRNNDRSDDVLAVPAMGMVNFDLRYIDNTWVAYGRERRVDQLVACFPGSHALMDLLRESGLASLPPYALAARGLDADVLAASFGHAPAAFQAGAPDSCTAVASTLAWRSQHVEEVLQRSRPAGL